MCRPPYFGTYCELCSGDAVCQLSTCNSDGIKALCASCVIDILEIFHGNDTKEDELFSDEFVDLASQNETLPLGSVLIMEGGQLAIILPDSFSASCSNEVNVSCPGLVIINQTLELDYEIQGKISHTLVCTYM